MELPVTIGKQVVAYIDKGEIRMHKPFLLLTIFFILITSCLHLSPAYNTEEDSIDDSTAAKVPLLWESTDILIHPKSDDTHKAVSIKDPTVVYYRGKWHIYATIYDTMANTWNMVYVSFSDWSMADSAAFHYMDSNPGFRGYKCAPQVFYLEPQKQWYLIYQSQPPTYSTATDIGEPSQWSAPKYFYRSKPGSAPNLWIDYWIICDAEHAYMFFSGDDGRLYRSQTTITGFPDGFGEVTIVLEFPQARDLFEACNVYKIKGTDKYLLLNECADSSWIRYFKAFISDSLDGIWYELAASDPDPFCGLANVTFESGVSPWTRDFSHGELLRSGYDQTMTIDDRNLRFLYQGRTGDASSYSLNPWSLGILNKKSPPNSGSVFDVDLKSLTPYSRSIDQYGEIQGDEGDKNVLVVELESCARQSGFSPLAVVMDSSASGGEAIEWPEGGSEQYLEVPSDSERGQVVIYFTLSKTAHVRFDIQVNMANGNDDSFYYKMDSDNWGIQNNVSTNGYQIMRVTTYNNLSAGKHILRILRREDGSLLDKVILKASSGEIIQRQSQ
jgi:hypothetical protein